MSVEKIYVINLNRRPDRLQEFKTRCPIDISKVEIFNAIDGYKYNSYDLDNFERHLYNISKSKSNGIGACGCFSSHYRLWKRIASDDNLNELSKIIIYEDDAFFTDNYLQKLNTIDSINEFDILYIGGRFHKNYVEGNRPVNGISKMSGQRTTHAYVITKKGANNLLNFIKNNIIHTVEVDTFLNNLKSILNMYDLYPHINWSPAMYKTDIQLPINPLQRNLDLQIGQQISFIKSTQQPTFRQVTSKLTPRNIPKLHFQNISSTPSVTPSAILHTSSLRTSKLSRPIHIKYKK